MGGDWTDSRWGNRRCLDEGFRGLARKWNAVATEPIPDDMKELLAKLK